jgi:pimeloyl-CoA synthetase
MYTEDETDKKIRQLRESTKHSPAVIAHRVHLSVWDVRCRLKKMGLPDDRRTKCTSTEGLKNALENGMSYRDMEREFGITSTTIVHYAKKWGLTRRHPLPMDDNVLITRYVNDLWSICKIARECGWCEPRVAKRLKDLGVIRSHVETKQARAQRRLRETGMEHSVDASGYPMIKAPEGVVTGRVLRNGMCFLHTLEMEKVLGRPLMKGEIVHHIDMDKGNFHRDNLHLCETKRAHNKIHGTLEAVCSTLYKKGVIGFNGTRYFLKVKGLENLADQIETPEPNPLSSPQINTPMLLAHVTQAGEVPSIWENHTRSL